MQAFLDIFDIYLLEAVVNAKDPVVTLRQE